MDRRKFIRGTGLFGGLLAGVVAGKTVVEKIHTKEIIKEIGSEVDADKAPTSQAVLMLSSSNPDLSTKKPKPVSTFNNTLNNEYGNYSTTYSMSFTPDEYEVVNHNQVSMAAGRDNRLWIKSNDTWYRLAVDKTVTNEKS
jgi:hypothetical protein